MRAHEFLCEQTHEDQAQDALVTLITTQHAMGIPEVKAAQLLKSLEDRNFFMDQDWLWDHVQQIPVVDVEASSPDQIKLKLPKTSKTVGDAADTQDAQIPAMEPTKKVAQMAKKALAQRNK